MIVHSRARREIQAPPHPALYVVGVGDNSSSPVFAVGPAGAGYKFEVRENGQIIAWSGIYTATIRDPYGVGVRIQDNLQVPINTADPSSNPPTGFSYLYVHDNAGAHSLRIKLPTGTVKQVGLT